MANLAYLQLTRECNQDCLFCSNPKSGQATTLEECLSQARLFQAQGYDGVILTGGEPTLVEWLPQLMQALGALGLAFRLITNGQRCADRAFLEGLKAAGLGHLHVSLYSARPEVQGRLTGNPDSLAAVDACLGNCADLHLHADVNITIQAWNQDHLDEVAAFVVQRHPAVRHVVFNFLDPSGPKAAARPDCLPTLPDTELSLHRALTLLASRGLSFRVERVPLCYLGEFAYASTETRKIVKGEERSIAFLDQKGLVRQRNFFHGKAQACEVCTLSPICAGLFELDKAYSSRWLYPMFLPLEPIVRAIRDGERS
jgi:MoaA/NifB/PqqE/SkfB family radical SAM enzyme